MQIFNILIFVVALRSSESQSSEKLEWKGVVKLQFISNSEDSSELTDSQLSVPNNDTFSPRVLVSGNSEHPIDTGKLPVDLVRIWLRELGLFQFQKELLQAKHITKKGAVLFELKNALMASQVVEAWSKSPKKGVLVGLTANQTEIDFFHDFPKSEFD